mgnify:CR=1 FL=1
MECLTVLIELISNSRKGSSTVEAALVIPLLILIIIGLISAGIRLEKRVELNSGEHVCDAQDVLKSKLENPEKIIRAKWVIR